MTPADDPPEAARQTGPLRGLRIVEFGHFIAAPFATRVLGDLGAEILKIEPPSGDPVRGWGARQGGQSLWWSVHGRNKKSVTLNLKEPAAREIALGLVAASDAVIENFRPGLMERLGLGPAELATARPGCVLVRISGFGQTGPRAGDASFGMIGEAIGGIRHLTGYPPGETDLPPVRTGVSLGDSVAGLYGAIGLLAALWERRATPIAPGTPARIVDVALTESVLSLLEGILPEYGALGRVRQPAGSRILSAAPTNAYPTADGAWVLVGANSDPLFARLCRLMGRDELTRHADYVDNPARIAHVDALDAEIAAWTSGLAADALLAALEGADIPASKIYTAADIAADPQYRARDAVRAVPDPLFPEPILQQAPVPRFPGENPDSIAWPGPAIGQHTDAVLAGVLGLSPARIAELRAEGAI